MGCPQALSDSIIENSREELSVYGVKASAAPNSICIKNATVNKAIPVKWLMKDGAIPKYAVALGDKPAGNDAPLTNIPGVQFLSVASSLQEVPQQLHHCHVGGHESGCALILEELCNLAEEASGESQGPIRDAFDVMDFISRVKSRL